MKIKKIWCKTGLVYWWKRSRSDLKNTPNQYIFLSYIDKYTSFFSFGAFLFIMDFVLKSTMDVFVHFHLVQKRSL